MLPPELKAAQAPCPKHRPHLVLGFGLVRSQDLGPPRHEWISPHGIHRRPVSSGRQCPLQAILLWSPLSLALSPEGEREVASLVAPLPDRLPCGEREGLRRFHAG